MAARYPIPRPTEDAALWNFEPRRLAPERIADLLIVARATSDRGTAKSCSTTCSTAPSEAHPVKRDVLLWAALAAALTVTASAEYDLARAAGFGLYVAAGVPAALDIYAVRALRARRDVAAVVLAMVAVQAAAHLVAAGLLAVSVPLVVAVSAIAPLVLWRVHRLAEHIDTRPSPAPEVHTRPDAGPAEPAAPPVAEPLVICGAGQVHTLSVPSEDDSAGVDSRLDAEQARMLIEHAWSAGLSVREAARLSTRSPSYAAKVYGRLEAEEAGPDAPRALVGVAS